MHGINAQFPFFYFKKFFFGQACMKKTKPIASLVIVNGANPGFDGGSCWENMPTVGRELDEGQLHHI